MAQNIPLLRTAEISVHRLRHPAEHVDQPYEEVASAFMANVVEEGDFNLEVDGKGWRLSESDVMLSRLGMRFRAGFDGDRFNDTCLSLTYLSADADRFDPSESWSRSSRSVLPGDNRIRLTPQRGT